MLRAFLLYLSDAAWTRRFVSEFPLARRVAARFVAGDRLIEALPALNSLNQQGLFVTVDHLGENVDSSEEASQAMDSYQKLLQQLHEARLKAGISVKLTQLGLQIDYELCYAHMRCLLEWAQEQDLFVRVDMEDSSTVDQTLALCRNLRAEGFSDIGAVIQAYLYRSQEDLERLVAEGIPVRLCKGAYKEPAEIAFPRKAEVDENFDRLTQILLDGAKAHPTQTIQSNGRIPPFAAIGTHDIQRIQFAQNYAIQQGLSKTDYEFQMLYGIRSDLQLSLLSQGHPVRIYVPYGTEWYPYFMRRLAERPANLWFFLSNLFR